MGRPKLYSETARPVSVTLRIPADVAEQMRRYAYKHRQTVTRLLLDGLRWRLEQDGGQYTKRQTSKSILPPRLTPADDLEDMPLWPVDPPLQPAESVPDYDQTKYVLGALCSRQHDYQGTGQTLRVRTATGRRCQLCEAALKREKRQGQRA